MAAPNLTTQSPRFRARCAELAAAHNLLGTCNWRGVGDGGRDVLTVPSASSTQPHMVTWDARTDQFTCDCKAATLGNQPCSHIGAAADYVTRCLRAASSDRAAQSASTDPAVYAFHGYAWVASNNPHEWEGARAEIEAFGLPTVDLALIAEHTGYCQCCGLDGVGVMHYRDHHLDLQTYCGQCASEYGLESADPADYELTTGTCIDCGSVLPLSELVEVDRGPDGEALMLCAECENVWQARMDDGYADREPMPYDVA